MTFSDGTQDNAGTGVRPSSGAETPNRCGLSIFFGRFNFEHCCAPEDRRTPTTGSQSPRDSRQISPDAKTHHDNSCENPDPPGMVADKRRTSTRPQPSQKHKANHHG